MNRNPRRKRVANQIEYIHMPTNEALAHNSSMFRNTKQSTKKSNTDPGTPSPKWRYRMRSTVCWFTESRNSQCVSQFATSFITTQAKTFTAAKNIFDSKLKFAMIPKNQIWLWSDNNSEELHRSRRTEKQRCLVYWTHDRIYINEWLDSYRANAPSAGSPTETLLRLLLPLSSKVYITSRSFSRIWINRNPNYSPDHSIGRSDGRCVQRAGT